MSAENMSIEPEPASRAETGDDAKLENQTKEQLLETISKLPKEDLVKFLLLSQQNTNQTSLSKNDKEKEKSKKKSKKDKGFNFQDFNFCYVAFKLAYFGWNYCGFAIQPHTSPTIEEKLFDAFLSTKLIETKDFKKNNYSRCGRTDRGVSSFGQVIALNVRGSKKKDKFSKNDPQISNFLIPSDGETEKPTSLAVDYMKMLNHHLPSDIQILAASNVSSDFDARFSCTYRTYKYFFLKKDLDIELMEKAAQLFVGSHDFRNFCKISVESVHSERSLTRRIVHIKIRPVFQITASNSSKNDENSPSRELFEIEICGFSFLWHQIRCMTSILFLIGKKLEDSSIITDLFDINKYPSRPQYPIASEKPLVLFDCGFEDIKWQYNATTSSNLGSNTQKIKNYFFGDSIEDVCVHSMDLFDESMISMAMYACFKNNVVNQSFVPFFMKSFVKNENLNSEIFETKPSKQNNKKAENFDNENLKKKLDIEVSRIGKTEENMFSIERVFEFWKNDIKPALLQQQFPNSKTKGKHVLIKNMPLSSSYDEKMKNNKKFQQQKEQEEEEDEDMDFE